MAITVRHTLHLGARGTFNIQVERVPLERLREGDLLLDIQQLYHGRVTYASTSRIEVDWFKWDPSIEHPLHDYLYPMEGASGWRIVDPPGALDFSGIVVTKR